MPDANKSVNEPRENLKPHRATTVLVLGILGLVVCTICGIIAWIFGKEDLKEMDSGRMDPSGRDTTRAGMICGMIASIIAIVSAVLLLLFAAISTVMSMQGVNM